MKIKIILLFILFIYTIIYAETSKIDQNQYIVKIGDIFNIQLMTIDTLVVKSIVVPEGSLSLYPISNNVFIAGKTLFEAYKIIFDKIDQNISRDKISIQLEIIAPSRFHIMGAVVNPGEYSTEELVTLQQALNISGGMASSASKRIKILRNKQILEFDLNEYFANNDISSNPLIMHDDVIMVSLAEKFVKVFTNNDTINYVESVELDENKSSIADVLTQLSKKHQWSNLEMFTVHRKNRYSVVEKNFILEADDRLFIPVEELYVYITGYVVRPGRHPYNGNMNALYYLSQSGGSSTNGARKKIFLLREHGKAELYINQEIRPGDTLYVPESKRSMFISYLGPVSTVVTMISTIVIISINLGK